MFEQRIMFADRFLTLEFAIWNQMCENQIMLCEHQVMLCVRIKRRSVETRARMAMDERSGCMHMLARFSWSLERGEGRQGFIVDHRPTVKPLKNSASAVIIMSAEREPAKEEGPQTESISWRKAFKFKSGREPRKNFQRSSTKTDTPFLLSRHAIEHATSDKSKGGNNA